MVTPGLWTWGEWTLSLSFLFDPLRPSVVTSRLLLRAGRQATDTSFRPVPAGVKDGPATGDKDGEGLDRCRIRLFEGPVRSWFLLIRDRRSRAGERPAGKHWASRGGSATRSVADPPLLLFLDRRRARNANPDWILPSNFSILPCQEPLLTGERSASATTARAPSPDGRRRSRRDDAAC